MNHEFYKSKRWKLKRDKILRRDNFECRQSKRYGKTVTAEMVHHIYPVSEYPELKFKDWNLISLSNKEHNKMHNRDDDTLTSKGIYWKNKMKPYYIQFLKNKNKKMLHVKQKNKK